MSVAPTKPPPAIDQAAAPHAASAKRAQYRFLAPFGGDRTSFEQNLKQRFTSDSRITEGVVEYADRVLDRQINKANGLLAFNGLLFTALSIANPGAGAIPMSIRFGSFFAVGAALLLLFLFVVSFGKTADYVSPESDFAAKCRSIYWRTYVICLSIGLSIAAAITSLWRLRWFWL